MTVATDGSRERRTKGLGHSGHIDGARLTATVRVRESFYWRGRLFQPHGQFKGLITLSATEALRFVESGRAELLDRGALRVLRAAAADQERLVRYGCIHG